MSPTHYYWQRPSHPADRLILPKKFCCELSLAMIVNKIPRKSGICSTLHGGLSGVLHISARVEPVKRGGGGFRCQAWPAYMWMARRCHSMAMFAVRASGRARRVGDARMLASSGWIHDIIHSDGRGTAHPIRASSPARRHIFGSVARLSPGAIRGGTGPG